MLAKMRKQDTEGELPQRYTDGGRQAPGSSSLSCRACYPHLMQDFKCPLLSYAALDPLCLFTYLSFSQPAHIFFLVLLIVLPELRISHLCPSGQNHLTGERKFPSMGGKSSPQLRRPKARKIGFWGNDFLEKEVDLISDGRCLSVKLIG